MSWLESLRRWLDRLLLRPADTQGPGGAFARTMAAAVTGRGLEAALDPQDARELLARALDPDRPRGPLRYPGWHRIAEARREAAFEAGLEILRGALQARPLEDGQPLEPELLVGTLIPVPGPGRTPVIHHIHLEPPDGAPAFARVDYGYDRDPPGHSLGYYRDAAGEWRLDLVFELAQAGAMQQALGGVQAATCSREPLEV